MDKKLEPVTMGPSSEKDADDLVKLYKDQGYEVKKKPRPGREGEFMVEISPK